MKTLNDLTVSEHFKLREFACRHCQTVKLDERLVTKLEELRQRIGKPLIVTSGYRCPDYNRRVGGAPKSQHVEGRAADVLVPEGMTVDQLAEAAEEVAFGGIGRYYKQDFVHVDVRGTRARWTD